jgi:hypothetical protein
MKKFFSSDKNGIELYDLVLLHILYSKFTLLLKKTVDFIFMIQNTVFN